MKTHYVNLTSVPYAKIASGVKVIESRLYDQKRQSIRIGDIIVFSESNTHCDQEKMNEGVNTHVVALLRYANFKELFDDHDPQMFGDASTEALLDEIYQYYTPLQEEQFGVVGLRIKRV